MPDTQTEMNPVGKWDHSSRTEPFFYGDKPEFEESYRIGMEFLSDCKLVEDWGCGTGYARKFRIGDYKGVDANQSRWCDVQADLRNYKSNPSGIFMRHVLEHSDQWAVILDNAVASFRRKMALTFFIPFGPKTNVKHRFKNGIPDIQFAWPDILSHLETLRLMKVILRHETDETILLLKK